MKLIHHKQVVNFLRSFDEGTKKSIQKHDLEITLNHTNSPKKSRHTVEFGDGHGISGIVKMTKGANSLFVMSRRTLRRLDLVHNDFIISEYPVRLIIDSLKKVGFALAEMEGEGDLRATVYIAMPDFFSGYKTDDGTGQYVPLFEARPYLGVRSTKEVFGFKHESIIDLFTPPNWREVEPGYFTSGIEKIRMANIEEEPVVLSIPDPYSNDEADNDNQ